MTRDELLVELEMADHGSLELDLMIEMHVRGASADFDTPYTTSTDAALTLLPPGWILDHLGDDAHGYPGKLTMFGATAEVTNGVQGKDEQGQAATRALAICAACLRASA